ncbi:MAG TPA: MarR family transcriptional regulator [Candidatus Binatia bacterium]|nr:MarR family transcriptional regulator [Candidatus Binatia bacterium]
MTTKSASNSRPALRAYLDAVALVEPMQIRLWREAGLTLTQARLLRRLVPGPQGQTELGRQLNLSPASMTRLIDRLEERGLVARQRDVGDRRRVTVRLEPLGRTLLGEAHGLQGSAVERAIDAMSEEARERLIEVLEDLVARTRSEAGDEELEIVIKG